MKNSTFDVTIVYFGGQIGLSRYSVFSQTGGKCIVTVVLLSTVDLLREDSQHWLKSTQHACPTALLLGGLGEGGYSYLREVRQC